MGWNLVNRHPACSVEWFGLHFCYTAWNFGQKRQYTAHRVTKACQGCNRQTSLYISSPFSAVCFLLQEELLVCGWGVSSLTIPQLSSLTDTYQPGAASLCTLRWKGKQLVQQTIELHLITSISCEGDLIKSAADILWPSLVTCLLCCDRLRKTAYVTTLKLKKSKKELSDLLQNRKQIMLSIYTNFE